MRIVLITLILSVYVNCQNIDDVGWRGLRPLRSTEQEVEAMLGKGEAEGLGYRAFNGDGFKLRVYFSPGRCSGDTFGRPLYSIPKGKIIEYVVYFKEPIALSSLHFNRSNYKVVPDPENPYRFVLRSPSDEVIIMAGEVDGNEVFNQIVMRPSQKALSKLTCNTNRN